jgi:hypothetical protein
MATFTRRIMLDTVLSAAAPECLCDQRLLGARSEPRLASGSWCLT